VQKRQKRRGGDSMMSAIDVLEELGIEKCRECGCPVGEGWEFKDFSNKTIITCPQCGEEYYIEEEEERLEEERHKEFYFEVHGKIEAKDEDEAKDKLYETLKEICEFVIDYVEEEDDACVDEDDGNEKEIKEGEA